MWTLLLSRQGDPPGTFIDRRQIDSGQVKVGRSAAACDLVVPDTAGHLSREHCVISAVGFDLFVVDTSTNGVALNQPGQRIAPQTPVAVRIGDRLILGDFVIEVASEAGGMGAQLHQASAAAPAAQGFHQPDAWFDAGAAAADPIWGAGPGMGAGGGSADVHEFLGDAMHDFLATPARGGGGQAQSFDPFGGAFGEAFSKPMLAQPVEADASAFTIPEDWAAPAAPAPMAAPPVPAAPDPFAGFPPPPGGDPFGASDPFGAPPPSPAPAPDPFAGFAPLPDGDRDPFADFVPPPGDDPFARPAASPPSEAPAPPPPGGDPFASTVPARGDDPFAAFAPPPPADDPFDLPSAPPPAAPADDPFAAPAAPTPAPAAPATAAPAPAPAPSPTGTPPPADWAAFCEGAGIDAADLRTSPDTMRRLGVLYRQVVLGLSDLIQDRAAFKDEFRVERTQLSFGRNNPLKHLAPLDSAKLLLADPLPGFMDAEAAVRAGLEDVKRHQLALLAGVQHAMKTVFERLSPAEVERVMGRATAKRGLLGRGVDPWAVYRTMWEALRADAASNAASVMSVAFREGYEAFLRQAKEAG